jgi:hypothetical protein
MSQIPLWTGGYALPCEGCGTPLLTDEERRGYCDDCMQESEWEAEQDALLEERWLEDHR